MLSSTAPQTPGLFLYGQSARCQHHSVLLPLLTRSSLRLPLLPLPQYLCNPRPLTWTVKSLLCVKYIGSAQLTVWVWCAKRVLCAPGGCVVEHVSVSLVSCYAPAGLRIHNTGRTLAVSVRQLDEERHAFSLGGVPLCTTLWRQPAGQESKIARWCHHLKCWNKENRTKSTGVVSSWSVGVKRTELNRQVLSPLEV